MTGTQIEAQVKILDVGHSSEIYSWASFKGTNISTIP